MFGFWQILILVVILLLIFGYKRLPALGRSAGEGFNKLRGSATDMIGDRKVDPSMLGKSAGKGVREFRELKDALSGSAQPADKAPAAREPAPPPATREPPPAKSETSSVKADREEPEAVDGELVNGGRSTS